MNSALLCQQAAAHHRQGRLADAENIYVRILAAEPNNFTAQHLLGVLRFQQGRPEAALQLLEQALRSKPGHAEALSNLGLVLHEMNRFEEALARFDAAVSAGPHYALAWSNRGNSLKQLNRIAEAIQSYDRAIALRPDYLAARFNRGASLKDTGRFAEALVDFEFVLQRDPGHVAALRAHAPTLMQLGRFDEALKSCEALLAREKDDPWLWNDHGLVLRRLERQSEALESFNRAIQLNPRYAEAHNNRGNVFRHLRRFAEALSSYEVALSLAPHLVEIWNNRGNTLQDMKRFEEAVLNYDSALAIDPKDPEALYNRGTALLHLQRLTESLQSMDQAVAAAPDHPDAMGGAANAALQLCDWRLRAAYADKLSEHVAQSRSIVPPFVLLGYLDDPALQLKCASRYAGDRVPVRQQRASGVARLPQERIRIAYVSADFRQHPVAYSIAPLLEQHDRSQFEIIGVALGGDDSSAIRSRIITACDGFIDATAMSDEAVAALLRRMQVAIAVDLTGYTQDARPGIFAWRAAPAQISFLGYPGTLGAGFMDYIIGDAVALPRSLQACFAERIVHVPGTFFPFPEPASAPAPSRQAMGLPERDFVFCCLNSAWKISPAMFDVWMDLLRNERSSVLWLKQPHEEAAANLRREAAARGISPERLIFAAETGRQAHLARMSLADLFLDTAPYNAHATAAEALNAGVPIVTCAGEAFAGRIAASMLHAAGLPELVTHSLAEYRDVARSLVRDPGRLNAARQKLSVALPDSKRSHREKIEAAYLRIHEAISRREIPQGFTAADTDVADQWNDRGAALQNEGRVVEALEAFGCALAAAPDHVTALVNRANILRFLNRFDESIGCYDRVIELQPRAGNAWSGRGAALWELGRFDGALASFNTAIALCPGDADALRKRGHLLSTRFGRSDAAIADLQAAFAIAPDMEFLRGDLLHLKMQCCEWDNFDSENAAVTNAVRGGLTAAQPFAFLPISDSPPDQQICSQTFARTLYPAEKPVCHHAAHTGIIRVGYVCSEFREQATAWLTAGLFELHDRCRFEVIAFDCSGPDPGPTRQRLENAFDRFVDISRMPDPVAAERIAAERIDILVSLNGWFGEHRMGVFARRPAPIQVNFLGFPGTLGTDYIDYMIADPITVPDCDRRYYNERVVWMPDSYQVTDSSRKIADHNPVRAGCGLPETGFVFCNFNQGYKLTPATFDVWMRILRRIPKSVLWLWQSNPSIPENLRREAERRGVPGERLVFAPTVSQPDHLARLQLADLVLDSLPYNAHTTASDALWAGVPVLTCRGHSFPGRVAASLLHSAGMDELITSDLDTYDRMACELACDPVRMDSLRQKLAGRRVTSPLFDTGRYRRNLEQAYEHMWRLYLRNESPKAFSANESLTT